MKSTLMENLTAKADRNRTDLKAFRESWDTRETIIIVPSQWAWPHPTTSPQVRMSSSFTTGSFTARRAT